MAYDAETDVYTCYAQKKLSPVFVKKQKSKSGYASEVTVTGIQYLMNRSIQVEGAFGVLKNDYEFQKFLLRGKTKVKLEILLLCMGYNLNKLHAKIQNERIGFHLFKVKSA